PPTFLLIHEPLAALPFQAVRFGWLAGTFALFAWSMRPWVQNPVQWVIVLAAPAIAFHSHAGQTGFLVAALLGFAMTGLRRNDRSGAVMAGVAIGFLTLKPHLWALLPLFLLIERRWTVFASAAATTGFLVILSLLAYGVGPWQAMFASVATGYAQNHADQFHLFAKMGNVDGFLRFFGLEAARSIVLVTIMAAALAAMVAMRTMGVPFALRLSFAVTASFVIAPHNMIYDHTLFVPLAVMLFLHPGTAQQNGLKGVLLLLLLWPALYALIPGLDAYPFSVGVVALFAGTLLATAWRTRTL
ncbi:MAG: glycosyltransferase family 87 protein, partial [Pseudomonadota bacterium]